MGVCRAMKRIMTKEAYTSGRCKQSAQDGSREFISLLACVSAIGRRLPSALIYQGEGYELMDTWVKDVIVTNEAHFAASSNGWSSDAFGLAWLVQVFHRYTRGLAGNRRRLLIVDGHSSHVNMAFLNKCDELRILVLILPPHSTHRLQPLDVGLFGNLSTAYSVEVDKWMAKSLGLVSMSKRIFWSLFLPAWLKSFTPEAIQKAFRKTGIWPLNGELVVQIIERPVTPPPRTEIDDTPLIKTPYTTKSIRHFQADYKRAPAEEKLQKLFKANEVLATQHSVDEHVKKGLIETVAMEKKRRKRGKKLNILGKEDHGPQFFSPTTLVAARERQEELEAKEEEEKARKASKKITAAENKARKEAEKEERALQRTITKEAKAELEAEKKAKKEAEKQAKAAAKLASKVPVKKKDTVKLPKIAPVVRKKAVRFVVVPKEGVGPVTPVKTSSSGRRIKTPQREVYK
jgi:hypothetical protein